MNEKTIINKAVIKQEVLLGKIEELNNHFYQKKNIINIFELGECFRNLNKVKDKKILSLIHLWIKSLHPRM